MIKTTVRMERTQSQEWPWVSVKRVYFFGFLVRQYWIYTHADQRKECLDFQFIP
jgi:uncharacterized membrane protein